MLKRSLRRLKRELGPNKKERKQRKELWPKRNLKKPRIKHELSSNSKKNKKRLKPKK